MFSDSHSISQRLGAAPAAETISEHTGALSFLSWRCIGWSMEATDSKFSRTGVAPTPTEKIIQSSKPKSAVLNDFRRSYPQIKNHTVHALDAKVVVKHRGPNGLPIAFEVQNPSLSEPQQVDSHPYISRRNPTDNHEQHGAVVPLTPDAPVMLSASQSQPPREERRLSPREHPVGSTVNPSDTRRSSSCRAPGVGSQGPLAVP